MLKVLHQQIRRKCARLFAAAHGVAVGKRVDGDPHSQRDSDYLRTHLIDDSGNLMTQSERVWTGALTQPFRA
jgi:hypothetical protein